MKILKLCFCKYFNKYLIQIKPVTKEIIIPKVKVPILAIINDQTLLSSSFKAKAPHTTGALK